MLRKCILLILSILSFLPRSIAQPLIIVDSTSKTQVGMSMKVLLPTGELSIADATKGTFLPMLTSVPNLGVSDHSIWLKFKVKNESKFETFVLYIDNPTLDEAELFWRDS